MRPLSFVYLREGSSDDGLLPHLRELIVRSGAKEAVGTINAVPGSVEDKLRAVLESGMEADLFVVHRDSDSRSSAQRRREIASAADAVGLAQAHVCVVPVQALETWLLLDEDAIRTVVGRPSGRAPLVLPKPRAVEREHDPKTVLQQALLDAREATGRRRQAEAKKWLQHRKTLMERLNLDGPITQVPSYQQLVDDLDVFVRRWLAGDALNPPSGPGRPSISRR